MPRYNVNKPNTDLWACFSTIIDDFITDFMPRTEYQTWREREYGIHCGEIESANLMDYEEALETIKLRESYGETQEDENKEYSND